MISIQQNLSELQKCHELGETALECYRDAIQNMARYAVELEPTLTDPHRTYLGNLATELTNSPADVLVESRSTLRGLLRDYRDRAAQYLNGLRTQMASTAEALQQMVEGLSQCDTDHAVRMRDDLARLREVAHSSAGPTRAVLAALADSIEKGLEQIQKQHQFTVSQLQTELRLLHSRVDSLEAAAATDEVSKLSTRRFMAEYLGAMPAEGASLLVLRMRGLAEARAKFGARIADDVVATFGRRLRNTVPKETVVGRWSEQDFLAIVPASKVAAGTPAKRVAEHLSMPYACMMSGKVVRVPMVVTAECLIVPANATPEQLQERVAEAFNRA